MQEREEGGVGAGEEEGRTDGENEEGMPRMEGAIERMATRDDVVVRLLGGTHAYNNALSRTSLKR